MIVKETYVATGIQETRMYLTCPECNWTHAHDVSHIYANLLKDDWRTSFGPWYCDACGFGISGKVHKNKTVTVTKEGRLYNTFALLRLNPEHGPVFIIVKDTHHPSPEDIDPSRSYELKAYWFEQHNCAINFLRDTVKVLEGDAGDPHGLFEYIGSVMATKEMEQAIEECGDISTAIPTKILENIWEAYDDNH